MSDGGRAVKRGGTSWHPYIATFVDGPLAGHGHDRVFAVGPPATDLWLMPAPPGWRGDYVLVGIDFAPDAPWSGQLHYRQLATGQVNEDGEHVVTYALERE